MSTHQPAKTYIYKIIKSHWSHHQIPPGCLAQGSEAMPDLNRDNAQNVFRVTNGPGEKQLKDLVEKLGIVWRQVVSADLAGLQPFLGGRSASVFQLFFEGGYIALFL